MGKTTLTAYNSTAVQRRHKVTTEH